ncbi:MAG: ATP-binding cassette domain-containing protein [Rhodospirillales bacterium]|nr:MAG: ATP-binding cassette domain-containing protein [Rhodospirillales bacterium]
MPVLTAESLSVTHGDGPPVLRDIGFAIAPGERVGLVGPNGAGKTTLLLTLTGVLRARAGSVRLGGRTLAPGTFTPEVALVFQHAHDQLFCPTVAEDVAFGARNLGLTGAALDRAVAEALDRVGLAALADRPVHHLSGGEQRLACLAGVLVMAPRVLLLDEPSGALDLRNRRRLIELLQGMEQAMLVASHDLELVLELCPRVLLIDGGGIVADGAAASVLGDAGLMAAHGQEVPHSLTWHRGERHRHRATGTVAVAAGTDVARA